MYEWLAPAVLGYFRAQRMRDPEGLTGDVFVAVTEKLHSFRGSDAALRRWVFTIAHHRRVDEIRRSTRSPEELREEVPTHASTDEHDLVDPALIDALDLLTDEQREVVVLRFVADLSIQEVARLTDRSRGSVKMLQARGLELLSEALQDAGEQRDPDRA